MIKKTKLTNYPIINEFLEQVGGEKASELVKFYEKKGKPIKDEDAAGKMKVKVTDVRTILNRLNYRGIANYQKTRNKKTGWYSYTWTIDKKRVLALIMEKQREEIEKTEQTSETEDMSSFFSCKKGCHEAPCEVAAEYQFRCPDCGSELKFMDSKKRIKQAKERLEVMRKEVEEFKKLK